MPHDWALDIALAPDGAQQRIAAAINRPKKRAFGVFKVENEFVGFVHDDTFEIWERHQRAVHAFGSVRGRRGGTHVQVRSSLPRRARVLIAIFFGLYAVAAGGLALREGAAATAVEELAIATVGGLALAAIFALATARQRADLRTFLDNVFRDVPRL